MLTPEKFIEKIDEEYLQLVDVVSCHDPNDISTMAFYQGRICELKELKRILHEQPRSEEEERLI